MPTDNSPGNPFSALPSCNESSVTEQSKLHDSPRPARTRAAPRASTCPSVPIAPVHHTRNSPLIRPPYQIRTTGFATTNSASALSPSRCCSLLPAPGEPCSSRGQERPDAGVSACRYHARPRAPPSRSLPSLASEMLNERMTSDRRSIPGGGSGCRAADQGSMRRSFRAVHRETFGSGGGTRSSWSAARTWDRRGSLRVEQGRPSRGQ